MQLAEIGEGYVLYFKLIIYVGWFAVIFFAINIYKTAVNFMGSYCIARPTNQQPDTTLSDASADPQCFIDWITPHSIANYGVRNIDMAERAMMVIYLGIFWGALALFYHLVMKIDGVIDCKNDTPSDYTLLVASFYQITDLPVEHDSEAIKKHLEGSQTFKGGEDVEITKISQVFRIEKYITLVSKIKAQKKIMRRLQIAEIKAKRRSAKQAMLLDDNQKTKLIDNSAAKVQAKSSKFYLSRPLNEKTQGSFSSRFQ